MLSLRPVDFLQIQHFFVDFQKKSKCLELPPDSAQYLGAFNEAEMVGYFVIQAYDGIEVEINQGYLKPEYRHFSFPYEFMKLLEEGCKKAGYKKMLLGTHNRFKSYLRFAKGLGYKPQHLVFSKEL